MINEYERIKGELDRSTFSNIPSSERNYFLKKLEQINLIDIDDIYTSDGSVNKLSDLEYVVVSMKSMLDTLNMSTMLLEDKKGTFDENFNNILNTSVVENGGDQTQGITRDKDTTENGEDPDREKEIKDKISELEAYVAELNERKTELENNSGVEGEQEGGLSVAFKKEIERIEEKIREEELGKNLAERMIEVNEKSIEDYKKKHEHEDEKKGNDSLIRKLELEVKIEVKEKRNENLDKDIAEYNKEIGGLKERKKFLEEMLNSEIGLAEAVEKKIVENKEEIMRLQGLIIKGLKKSSDVSELEYSLEKSKGEIKSLNDLLKEGNKKKASGGSEIGGNQEEIEAKIKGIQEEIERLKVELQEIENSDDGENQDGGENGNAENNQSESEEDFDPGNIRVAPEEPAGEQPGSAEPAVVENPESTNVENPEGEKSLEDQIREAAKGFIRAERANNVSPEGGNSARYIEAKAKYYELKDKYKAEKATAILATGSYEEKLKIKQEQMMFLRGLEVMEYELTTEVKSEETGAMNKLGKGLFKVVNWYKKMPKWAKRSLSLSMVGLGMWGGVGLAGAMFAGKKILSGLSAGAVGVGTFNLMEESAIASHKKKIEKEVSGASLEELERMLNSYNDETTRKGRDILLSSRKKRVGIASLASIGVFATSLFGGGAIKKVGGWLGDVTGVHPVDYVSEHFSGGGHVNQDLLHKEARITTPDELTQNYNKAIGLNPEDVDHAGGTVNTKVLEESAGISSVPTEEVMDVSGAGGVNFEGINDVTETIGDNAVRLKPMGVDGIEGSLRDAFRGNAAFEEMAKVKYGGENPFGARVHVIAEEWLKDHNIDTLHMPEGSSLELKIDGDMADVKITGIVGPDGNPISLPEMNASGGVPTIDAGDVKVSIEPNALVASGEEVGGSIFNGSEQAVPASTGAEVVDHGFTSDTPAGLFENYTFSDAEVAALEGTDLSDMQYNAIRGNNVEEFLKGYDGDSSERSYNSIIEKLGPEAEKHRGEVIARVNFARDLMEEIKERNLPVEAIKKMKVSDFINRYGFKLP